MGVGVDVADHRVKNPKDAIAVTKVPVQLFPGTAIAAGSMGLLSGKFKYGENNYLATPVSASVYVGAAMRHLLKLAAGIDLDEDEGMPQECYILACLAIYVDAKAAGTLVDDRKFNSTHLADYMKDLSKHIPRLMEMYGDRNPRQYTIADNEKV